MKQYLKPCARKASERASSRDGVPFVECASELLARGAVKLGSEPERKRVRNGRHESRAADAKPGELSLGRLKRG